MDNHELCDCYHFIRKEIPAHDGTGRIIMSGYGVCYGTKECNQCYCGGDTDKCDFYPEKRKESSKMSKTVCYDGVTGELIGDEDFNSSEEKKEPQNTMNTAQMWIKAQKDGKIYVSVRGDVAYSKKTGLVEKYDLKTTWELSAWDCEGAHALDSLLGEIDWVELSVMTRAEAEEKFGIKIVD